MRRVLLITNKVMHYRVSVYNYFTERFKEYGWEMLVRGNELQKENPHPLKFEFEEIPFNFHRYRMEIRKIKPDAVIIFLHLKDRIIWPLVHWLKLKRIPLAFWTKGINLDDPGKGMSYLLYKYMHALCDGIILYSRNELRYISRKIHPKVFIANNTINFDDFPEIKESKEDIRKEFGIPFNKVVLSVGRMDAGGGRKKIDHLIEVFNKVRNKGIGLVIVGSGMSKELLRKMNKENSVYLGEIYDARNLQISKIFKMADIFCVPGHVGLGLNEAFYWGLPIVTEAGGQPPEIHYLIDGRNGFIVPNNDIEELRKKLLYLLENEPERIEFSKKAREDILKNGSIEGMFNGFLKCVGYLAQGKEKKRTEPREI